MKKIILAFFILNFYFINLFAQWKSLGPFGGNINCLTTSGKNVFASTQYNGLFFSSDNGANWKTVNNPSLGKDLITGLTSVGSNIFASTRFSGIFLSTDNGNSWTAVNNGLYLGISIASIFALTSFGNNIYAGSQDGIYLSNNNGANWIKILSGSWVISLAASDSVVIAGTSDHGIFLSTNFGNTWNGFNNGLWNPSYAIQSVAILGTNLFAGNTSHTFIANINGANWTQINNGLPPFTHVNTFLAFESRIIAGTNLNIHLNNGVFLFNNNDSTWNLLGLANTKVNSLACSGNNLYAGTSEGFFLSNDSGNTWTSFNNGLTDIRVNTFTSIGQNIFIGTDHHGIFKSSDNGDSWQSINNGYPNLTYSRSLHVFENYIFISNDSGTFLSNDLGNSWSKSFSKTSYSFANSDSIIFTTNNLGVYNSSDTGKNWFPTKMQGLLYPNYVAQLATLRKNIFVTVLYGDVYKSIDNGNNWIVSDTNFKVNDGVRCFTLVGNNIFAGTEKTGLILSADSGTTWKIIDTQRTKITALVASGQDIYCRATGGIFLSKDSAKSWTNENLGLGDTLVLSLNISGNYLFAGTNSGIWRRALSEMDEIKKIPKEEKTTIQIFPNPFSTIATLKISPEIKLQNAEIKIYDVLGREVMELRMQNSECRIERGNLANGIYFYKIISGKEPIANGKLVIQN